MGGGKEIEIISYQFIGPERLEIPVIDGQRFLHRPLLVSKQGGSPYREDLVVGETAVIRGSHRLCRFEISRCGQIFKIPRVDLSGFGIAHHPSLVLLDGCVLGSLSQHVCANYMKGALKSLPCT